MSAQSMGTVTQGAGGVVYAGPDGTLCKAFNVAVTRYCRKAKKTGKGGKFNNSFFKALKQEDKGLWGSLLREKPIGALVGRTLGSAVATSFEDMTNGSGILAKGASVVLDLLAVKEGGGAFAAGNSGMDAMRGGLAGSIYSKFRGAGSDKSIQQVLFPDAMDPDGNAIEIKGPGDGPNPKGQPENYADMSPNKKCVVVDCEHCGAKCNSSGCT